MKNNGDIQMARGGPVRSRARLGVLLALLLGLGLSPAGAATCTVPSAGYTTIQAAVDDPACSDVLLGEQAYVESVTIGRSLNLQGVSSTATVIQGQVTVTAGSVELDNLRVDTSTAELAGRFAAVLVAGQGAEVHGLDLVVVHRALLFGDGFETGTTVAWSSTVP